MIERGAYAIKTVPAVPGLPVLDCCTGTADLAIAYAKAFNKQSEVFGSDFCREMLVVGKGKVLKHKDLSHVTLIEADTRDLPFANDRFGVVSVAFGLRNVANTIEGVDEMVRVLKPGGKLAILEFSKPRGKFLGKAYLFFFRKILPKIGQSISPNSHNAYSYLPKSVLEFPDGQAMVDLLRSRGLVGVESHQLTLGVATLYVGTKSS